MPRDIDLLTAPSVKHLRDRWWDARFDAFVIDTLQPRTGDWILEVGAGTGLSDLTLAMLQPDAASADREPAAAGVRVRYIGIDRQRHRLAQAQRAAAHRGLALDLAVAEAATLPLRDAACASTLCVGVLQHAEDPAALVRELRRVTIPNGRVLLVEPDNTSRYWYSALPSGMRAFELSQEFFRACEASSPTPSRVDRAIGAHVPNLCRANGIDPIAVTVFPVDSTRLGAPVSTVWQTRRETIARLVAESPADARAIGEEWLRAVEQYAADSAHAGPAFLEIQHTMLIATVGQVRA